MKLSTDKKFSITNNGILVSLVVLMFLIVIQFTSAQIDYRNFNSYISKDFSILYPQSWHIWNSTGTYSQPGTTQVTLGKELIGNEVVDINNFPTIIAVTVIPSGVTGIKPENILSSWIDNSYSPQNQRKYGMYALEDNPIVLSGIPARKISYNIDYNCGGNIISSHNILIYAYNTQSWLNENTYVISYIEPSSKSQFDSTEIQSIIKSFEIKNFPDLATLERKATGSPEDAISLWAARSYADAHMGEHYNTSLIDELIFIKLATLQYLQMDNICRYHIPVPRHTVEWQE